VARVLLEELCRVNPEYAAYVPVERQELLVELYQHGDPAWFPVGVKHKYTLNS
jgi:phenylacetate-CoA ligase